MLFSTKKLGSLHVKLTCNTLFAVLYPQSTYASIYASERSTRLPFSPQRLLEHLATVFWSPVHFISHVYWTDSRKDHLEKNLGIDCICPYFKDVKTYTLEIWIQFSTFSSNCLPCWLILSRCIVCCQYNPMNDILLCCLLLHLSLTILSIIF